MRLTPLDIRKQEFSRRFRGYDAEEVQAFLNMVSNQWEELLDDVRRKDEKVRELEGKLSHYEKVEEALQEALQTARETSRKSIENAEEKASMMIEQAEARAEAIKRDAELERHQIKREAAKLSGRKSEIVTRLRAFLMSEMELLASYEGDDPVGFIKLLPADKQRLRQLSERLDEEEKGGLGALATEAGGENPEKTSATGAEAPGEREGPGAERGRGEASPEDIREEAIGDEGKEEGESSDQDEQRFWLDDSFEEEGERGGQAHPYEREESARSEEDVRGADQEEEGRRAERGEAQRASFREEPSHDRPEREEDTLSGPGWTTHTFISASSDEQSSRQPEEETEPDDETTSRASSDEIEKIRRILSDLD